MTHNLRKIGFCLALGALAVPAVSFADKAPAKQAEKAEAGAKSLEEQMLGYWAPDAKAMMDLFLEKTGGDANAEAMLPMIEAMVASMAFEVRKGEVSVHVMGEKQSSTYTITETDKAAGTLTMTVKDEQGEGTGTATIKGDKLTLEKDGEKVVLTRIDKKEFEKRKTAEPVIPGIPGQE